MHIPRNIILRYSRGDLILDQFAGGGTTLAEAKLLNRDIIGIDITMWLRALQEKTALNTNLQKVKIYKKVIYEKPDSYR